MHESHDRPGTWQDALNDLLRRSNVSQFAYVPDAGHRILIDRSVALDPSACRNRFRAALLGHS